MTETFYIQKLREIRNQRTKLFCALNEITEIIPFLDEISATKSNLSPELKEKAKYFKNQISKSNLDAFTNEFAETDKNIPGLLTNS